MDYERSQGVPPGARMPIPGSYFGAPHMDADTIYRQQQQQQQQQQAFSEDGRYTTSPEQNPDSETSTEEDDLVIREDGDENVIGVNRMEGEEELGGGSVSELEELDKYLLPPHQEPLHHHTPDYRYLELQSTKECGSQFGVAGRGGYYTPTPGQYQSQYQAAWNTQYHQQAAAAYYMQQRPQQDSPSFWSTTPNSCG